MPNRIFPTTALGCVLLAVGTPHHAAETGTPPVSSEIFEVENPPGGGVFVPLDFEIVRTLAPTVRVTLPPERCVEGTRVILDDTDPQTPEQDVTGLVFPSLGPPDRCQGSARLGSASDEGEARRPGSCSDGVDNDGDDLVDRADPGCASTVGFGTNTLRLGGPPATTARALSERALEARMFNYTAVTIVVSPSSDADDVIERRGIEFHRTDLLLDFADGTPDPVIADFLRAHGLRPIGLLARAGAEDKLVFADASGNPAGLDPLDLAEVLEAPFLSAVSAGVLGETFTALGEAMPQRLADAADSGTGGFDNAELRLAWEHFFTDLFPAHRLRDHLVAGPTRTPLLAVIGSGFGNGDASVADGNGVLSDVSLARLGPRDADGDKLRDDGGMDFEGLVVTGPDLTAEDDPGGAFGDAELARAAQDITRMTDGIGHETAVAARAAGGGAVVLGPGKDVNVLPIRVRYVGDKISFPHYLIALRLAAHGTVDVINLSNGFPHNADRERIFRNYVDLLSDKILVVASGNNRAVDLGDILPQRLAPVRGAGRGRARYPRLILVSATDIADEFSRAGEVRGPEKSWPQSTVGAQISLSAPGGARLWLRNRDGDLVDTDGGTSWAAPVVAGLAAELIQLDEAERGAPANGAARRRRRLQIVEIIEATADDLGSSGRRAGFVNDRPGTGPDDDFGWGRVNAWKATLAVANRGLAPESHGLDGNGRPERFPSLTSVADGTTRWYGFKVHSPVRGATVWLDGTRLDDDGSNAPGEITAYAGVRSDRVVRIGTGDAEDPTSGVVPVGNQGGEHLATFSVGGPMLRRAERLELRTGTDGDETPFMVLDVRDTEAMRRGEVPGVVFDDFVFYVTPADFGDADPIRSYEVLTSQGGARHLNSTLEWLGRPGETAPESVSAEVDADDQRDTDGSPNVEDLDGTENDLWDQDAGDRGARIRVETLHPGQPGQPGEAEVTICAADENSGRYGRRSRARDVPGREREDGSLYLDAWLDWDANGDWDDPPDHILDGAHIDPAAGFEVTRQPRGNARLEPEGDADRHCRRYTARFPLPRTISRDGLWARFRLDYGEDAGGNEPGGYPSLDGLDGRRGAARHGEVEDHLLAGEFGDANPRHPTRLEDNGARHVDSRHEWFGRFGTDGEASVSPEYDAVDPLDVDGTPNLRPDGHDLDRFDDGVTFFPLGYRIGRRGRAEFTVCVDRPGDRYDAADPDRQLYVNAWIDWTTAFDWQEVNAEHVIDGLRLAPEDAAGWAPRGLRAGNTAVTLLGTAPDGRCARYRAEFDVGEIGTGELWARFRLDYGEDAGRNDPRPRFRSDGSLRDPALAEIEIQPPGRGRGWVRGAARFGEVEDYLLGSDFGDAPDPHTGPNRYPTRRPLGARHLDVHREWLGPAAPLASVSREVDGCDVSGAEQDRIPNLDAACAGADKDGKDDGADVPREVLPGEELTLKIRVAAKIDSFGFANRGPSGEDSKAVETLKEDCELAPIGDRPDTPVQHRDRGRYAAWDPKRRLYLNVWADWNADGVWADEERVVSGPLDPEDWGPDTAYTLGEPFRDRDGNGVRTEGERFTQIAGKTTRELTCKVTVPAAEEVAVNETFFWRFRLDYGENAVSDETVVHHAAEDGRRLDQTRGGALWGEVEDYPMQVLGKSSTPSSVSPGGDVHYQITLRGGRTSRPRAPARIVDALPELVAFAGNLRCTTGSCDYDGERRTVVWNGELSPRQTVAVDFDVTVAEEIPELPPEICNRFEGFDGADERVFTTCTRLEPGPQGALRFSSPAYRAAEGDGAANVTVERIGGGRGRVSVDYTTRDGTATAGADYEAASGTLTWAAGDTARKTFRVPVADDDLVEPDETVDFVLANPTGGAFVAIPGNAVLTITGDERDCNRNGVDDAIDIENGTTRDIDGSGVPDLCEIDTVICYLSGTAESGEITITVDGFFETCAVTVTTVAGESAATVLAHLAAAIRSDACLSAQDITADADGAVLSVTGFRLTLADIVFAISDLGLSHTVPVVEIPVLSVPGLSLMALLLLALGVAPPGRHGAGRRYRI